MAKGEIAHHEQFHLWPKSFKLRQNASAVGEGLNVHNVTVRLYVMRTQMHLVNAKPIHEVSLLLCCCCVSVIS